MASCRPFVVVLLVVASICGGERLLNGNRHDADAETSYFVSGGSPDARLGHAHNLPISVDAGNDSCPMPAGAAVKGEAFPRGVSVNGVVMVDIATGGRLPQYISAEVAASLNDTAGALMEELDVTVWTAAGIDTFASLIFNITFAVNAGRLFCFTRYMELLGIDGGLGWSNWRQAEASFIFDVNGIVVAFEASAEPRFSPGWWRFRLHRLPTGTHLKVELSGHPLLNVTRINASHSRPILTNNLPMSVDAGNGSIPAPSGLAVEGEALPRKVSADGVQLLEVTAGGQLLEDMFIKAADFIDTASDFMALLNATVWTGVGSGRDSVGSLLFNITFAVNGGRLFCFTRHRERSGVASEGVWSNWQQAEARPITLDRGQAEFRASADPRVRELASQSVEYMSWYSPGWSFYLPWREGPLHELGIKLFGSPLRYVARVNLESFQFFSTDLQISVDAGNGAVPVRSGAALGGEALPRGVSADWIHKVKIAARGRLMEDIITRVSAAVNDTAGALMAELDGTVFAALGQGPIRSFIFRVSFAMNAGRLFCFTSYLQFLPLDAFWVWSNWRQAEARPVFDDDGTAIAFEASAEPEFWPGWRFLASYRSNELLRLEISLLGYPLAHVILISNSSDASDQSVL